MFRAGVAGNLSTLPLFYCVAQSMGRARRQYAEMTASDADAGFIAIGNYMKLLQKIHQLKWHVT
jgi:hypothetical protein